MPKDAPQQANKLHFRPEPKVSYLMSLSPTEPRFEAALESEEPVFPSAKADWEAVAAARKEAEDAASEGRFSEAQCLVGPFKRRKLMLENMDIIFNLVQDCEKDAKAAYKMEFGALEFERAGEWSVIVKACEARLSAFREQQEEEKERSKVLTG
jgi:hypothetical protein